MSPTPEQLSQWRRKLEASRAFEDDSHYAFSQSSPQPVSSTKANASKEGRQNRTLKDMPSNESTKSSKDAQKASTQERIPSCGSELVNINRTAAEVYQVDYKARMGKLVAEEERSSRLHDVDKQGGAVQPVTLRKSEDGVLRLKGIPVQSPSGRKYGLPVLRALQAKEFEPEVKHVAGK